MFYKKLLLLRYLVNNLCDNIKFDRVKSYSKIMNNYRRNFLKLFSSSYLFFLLPYNLLHSTTKKIINKNLTKEQKKLCLMNIRKDHSLVL